MMTKETTVAHAAPITPHCFTNMYVHKAEDTAPHKLE